MSKSMNENVEFWKLRAIEAEQENARLLNLLYEVDKLIRQMTKSYRVDPK